MAHTIRTDLSLNHLSRLLAADDKVYRLVQDKVQCFGKGACVGRGEKEKGSTCVFTHHSLPSTIDDSDACSRFSRRKRDGGIRAFKALGSGVWAVTNYTCQTSIAGRSDGFHGCESCV